MFMLTHIFGTFVCSFCLENDVSTSVLVGYVCVCWDKHCLFTISIYFAMLHVIYNL